MNEDLKSVTPSGLSSVVMTRGHTMKSQNTLYKGGIRTAPEMSPFEGIDQKLQKQSYHTKMDESRFLRKSSDTYFFEIFNKLKKKCAILVPDTIFVGGGTFLSWYFTSKKNGAILKKNSHKLNAAEVFKNLYRQSSLSQEEDFNDKKITEYLKNDDSSDEENGSMNQQNLFGGGMIAGDGTRRNSRRNSVAKNQNIFAQALMTTTESIQEKQWSLKRILKEMNVKTLNPKSMTKHDDELPCIAYVKFHSQKSRGFKPFEFYQLIHERLGEVKMIQTFITTRVQINLDPNAPQKYKKLPQGGCYYCEYTHTSNNNPPQYVVTKQQVSQDLLQHINKDVVRSINTYMNQKFEDKAKVIISFMENTTRTDIKRACVKFLEDTTGEIYYLGVCRDILYAVKGQDSGQDQPLMRLPNDSFVFGGNKILSEKTNWKEAAIPKICYGEFCEYQFNDTHKFLSYRGKKKEFERNFSLIPDKNKIFNVNANEIAINIEDEQEMFKNALQTRKEKNNLDDLGMGLGNYQSQITKSSPYIKKKLYPDSFNQLYKAVTVCKSCFLIYSLLSDYFDELTKVAVSPRKKNANGEIVHDNPSSTVPATMTNWTHSEKLLQKKEEKPFIFSHKRLNSITNINNASTPKNQGQQYESKKSYIFKNLASVDIANLKGNIIFRNQTALISIEGHRQSIYNTNSNQRGQTPHNQTTTASASTLNKFNNRSQPLFPPAKGNFNKTTTMHSSTKNLQLNFGSTQSAFGDKLPHFIRPTESVKIKEIQKLSYKFVNTIEMKESQAKRNIKNVLGQKVGDRLFKQIMQKQSKLLNNHREQEKDRDPNKPPRTPGSSRNKKNKMDVKNSMSLALNSLFKMSEEKFYLKRAKENHEKRKIINFFNEVCKDPKKYELVLTKHKQVDNKIKQMHAKSLVDVGRQNSVLDMWHTGIVNNQDSTPPQNSPTKSQKQSPSKDGAPTDSRNLQINPITKLATEITQVRHSEQKESRRRTVLTSIDNDEQVDGVTKANAAFQMQGGILSLAQKIISQQMVFLQEQIKEKEESGIIKSKVSSQSSSLLGISKGNEQEGGGRKIRLSIRGNSPAQKRRNPNITSSVFHHQNLAHIKPVPFYRISTPKAPFYSNELIGDKAPDDKYIIPTENYKTMNIEQYAELMRIDKQQLQDCGVFFINEHTSMLYCILENSQEHHNINNSIIQSGSVNLSSIITKQNTDESPTPRDRSNFNGLRPGHQANQRRKVFHNYIVILDLFDSFIDKLEFFEQITKNSSQPARFILLNLPGQLHTQYNSKQSNPQLLNNSYYSNCLDLLLFHLHEKNLISCLFEPYSLVGFGNGANIALHYALQINDTNDNLRSILLFNGFSFVDQMLRDTINQALDSFKKCPPDMRDLGDFFFQNLILSSDNLNQNLNTRSQFSTKRDDGQLLEEDNSQRSIYNDRTSRSTLSQIETLDKTNLCRGLLGNISIKEKLKYLKMPIIYVYSKKNCLIGLKHSDIIQKVYQNQFIINTLVSRFKRQLDFNQFLSKFRLPQQYILESN
ncbi:UNKNOWN [Stylonychia lemnae]|uniref:Uncharacterized protein n=1 Tax=Stylonychia lemnae TaxID=5949 RepID=A0A078A9Q4_STYLE|nr:UNKNOWN [Stylonychia lemnae]|eukprot:CDW78909.1 UNKNOWN [Stylonychia lemnae]